MSDFSIDLDSLDGSVIQEVISIDGDVNPLAAPAPVDDGTHRAKLLFKDDSTELKEIQRGANKGKPFINMQFSAQVLAEGTKNNNKRVFGRVNTLVFEGKSEMAYIIRMALGDTPEARQYIRELTNYVDLAKAFKQVLSGEPTVRVVTQWVASRKTEDKNGNTVYEVFLRGQKNFPPREGGGYENVVIDKKTGQEVSAQVEIKAYLADGAE